MKRTLVYSVTAKIRRHNVACLTSAGNIHIPQLKFFTALLTSVNDCESTASINFGVRNTFLPVDEFTNTKFTNDKS